MGATAKRQRTCIGCRAVRDRESMTRIVRTPEGLVVDASGRLPGRGAYLCGGECLEKALRNKGFERAFKGKVAQAEKERVAAALCSAAVENGIDEE